MAATRHEHAPCTARKPRPIFRFAYVFGLHRAHTPACLADTGLFGHASRRVSRIGTFTLHRSSNELLCCDELPCSYGYGASAAPCFSSDAQQMANAPIPDILLARAKSLGLQSLKPEAWMRARGQGHTDLLALQQAGFEIVANPSVDEIAAWTTA